MQALVLLFLSSTYEGGSRPGTVAKSKDLTKDHTRVRDSRNIAPNKHTLMSQLMGLMVQMTHYLTNIFAMPKWLSQGEMSISPMLIYYTNTLYLSYVE